MGYWKQHKRREADRRRERRLASRSSLEKGPEYALHEAVAFASLDGLDQWLYVSEVLVAIDDLFPGGSKGSGEVVGTFEDEEFSVLYPTVWALCTTPVDGKGAPRELSTLLFFGDGGAWKVRLSERNHRLDLWAGGDTFTAALGGLEAQLLKRPVPWRKSTIPSGRK